MSDLIDRQNAIDVLEILADKMSDEGQTVMAQAVAVLKDLHSAEPEQKIEKCTKNNCPFQKNISNDCDIKTCPYRTERKKGKWVYDGIRGRFPACKCSICGHYENADWAILQGANFCPHCGADMRGDHE